MFFLIFQNLYVILVSYAKVNNTACAPWQLSTPWLLWHGDKPLSFSVTLPLTMTLSPPLTLTYSFSPFDPCLTSFIYIFYDSLNRYSHLFNSPVQSAPLNSAPFSLLYVSEIAALSCPAMANLDAFTMEPSNQTRTQSSQAHTLEHTRTRTEYQTESDVAATVKSLCLYCRAWGIYAPSSCVSWLCLSRSLSLFAGRRYRALVQKDTMRWQLRLAGQA